MALASSLMAPVKFEISRGNACSLWEHMYGVMRDESMQVDLYTIVGRTIHDRF